MSGGQVIVGGSQSQTVIFCVQDEQLPAASQAVQVTTVVPTGKHAGASLVTVTGPQLSLTVGVPRATVAQHAPGSVHAICVNSMCIALALGDQVCPPSRLSSVKMSKKLSIW